MIRKIKNFCFLTTLIVLFSALSTLGLAQETAKTTELFKENNAWATQIKKNGELRVGFDTFRPWAMMDKTGKYIGFEIDVSQKLADQMGVKLKLIPTGWDGIIPALFNENFDILIGGLGITAERSKKVAFTDPYEYSGIAIVANKSKAEGFNSIADFNKPEITIAVKLGTTAAIAAKEIFPKAKLLQFNDEGQTSQELKNNRAHALLAGAPFPAELAAKNPDTLFIPIPGLLTKEPCGMALAPKNKEALADLNSWIKENQDSGWLTKRWEYWFEGNEWEKELK